MLTTGIDAFFFFFFLRDFIFKKTLFEKLQYLKTRTIKSLKEEERALMLKIKISIESFKPFEVSK